jgi:hypothetical protein
MLLRPMDRVDVRSIEHFGTQVASLNKPIVITGAALAWPAMTLLRLSELKSAYGAFKIPVRMTDDELHSFFGAKSDAADRRTMMPLGDYIDIIQRTANPNTRPPYAGNISILRDPAVAHRLRSLLAGCRFPDWLPDNSRDEYRLWIAAAGQRSTIHNDAYDNFNAQIVGRKRFLIFAPRHHKALYAVFLNASCWASSIDARRPDFESYPLARNVEGLECELDAGDILYVPRFWWHAVEALTPCVNVNRWILGGTKQDAWWHQQQAAREYICYQELLDSVRRQYEELPADAQELHRAEFDELSADLIRLMTN